MPIQYPHGGSKRHHALDSPQKVTDLISMKSGFPNLDWLHAEIGCCPISLTVEGVGESSDIFVW